MARNIRVLVVDDHDVVREGLAGMIQGATGMEMVGEAANGSEALGLCHELEPDVVLMDLEMPVMGGVEATAKIHEQFPNIRILILTSFGDQERMQAAIDAGAKGYILKRASIRRLTATIREVYEDPVSHPFDAPEASISPVSMASEDDFDLTPRQRRVLTLIAEGLTNVQIADQIGCSHAVVKTAVSAILQKLEARSRVEAVAIAAQHGLIDS